MTERKSPFRLVFRAFAMLFTFVRRLLLSLFVLALIAMGYLIWQGGPPIKVDDGVAMVLVPFGQIVDQDDVDPRARLADELLGEEPQNSVLSRMREAIEAAAEDGRIKLLFLKLDTGFSAGQAQLEELALAIARFKQSGKPVYAYAPDLGQSEYFLAAMADRIFIDPMGMVFFPGFERYPLYYHDALEKLGVSVNVFRVGEFKSAVEPFLRNSMSDSARDNAQGWLDGLWSAWLQAVAAARGLSADRLQAYSDGYAGLLRKHQGDPAQLALAQGLVDEVLPLHDLRKQTGEIVGMDGEHGSFRQIDHRSYLRALRHEGSIKDPVPPQGVKRISVVVVQGEIVAGESSPGFAGGDTIRRLIDQARENKDSAALLLRVDSPGGSVFASEQIRRAVARYRESGRPVVVSMASLAASGGYWISMNANQIMAHATTITGSIGVFGLIPTFERSLQKIGVHSDGVGTTTWSGGLSPLRPLSDHAKQGIQMLVEKDYRLFIQQVADARGLGLEFVDQVAQGQVWTGAMALDHGLIDGLGDYDAAADKAAELAGLDEVRLESVMPPMDIRMRLLERFSLLGQLVPEGLLPLVDAGLGQLDGEFRRWSDPKGIYAHCECQP